MDLKVREARTVINFLEVIQDYSPTLGWIFRGQGDESWPLLPKAGRPEFYNPDWDIKRNEEVQNGKPHPRPPQDLGRFNGWRKEAVAYAQSLPSNDFESLAYAQHYGLATRLLDWTENPLAALYFAAASHHDVNGAVHAYFGTAHVDVETAKLGILDRIAVYTPRPIDRRVLAQAAVFTYHPEPQIPLTPNLLEVDYAEAGPDGLDLVKIVIPFDMKHIIVRHLAELGMSRKSLFPDLEGLSAYVNWRTTWVDYSKKRMAELRKARA
jgi:hypothetical protein